MNDHLRLRAATAFALLLLSVMVRADSGERVVSSRQVALALHTSGWHVDPDQVQFLFPVNTRQPNAALKLIRVDPWQDGLQKAEIRCVDASACLPFFILIHADHLPATQDDNRVRPVGTSQSQHHDVHVGDAAVLIFERSESRITLQVICEQNGNRGQRIKVATRDRKHFYEAEIVGPGQLRGTL